MVSVRFGLELGLPEHLRLRDDDEVDDVILRRRAVLLAEILMSAAQVTAILIADGWQAQYNRFWIDYWHPDKLTYEQTVDRFKRLGIADLVGVIDQSKISKPVSVDGETANLVADALPACLTSSS